MENTKEVLLQILGLISYEGDKNKHADDLQALLTREVNIKTYEVVRDFFFEYIRSLEPTLNEEQKHRLTEYLQKLKTESTQAGGISGQ